MRTKVKNGNFLDLTPCRLEGVRSLVLGSGVVQLFVPQDTLWDKLLRFLFHPNRPREVRVDLDAIGSAVWDLIDGNKTVHEIGLAVRKSLGDEVEPLYERLASFLSMLQRGRVISLETRS